MSDDVPRSGMVCPKCDGDTGVLDTRPRMQNKQLRRRRKCLSCGHRFSTYEVAAEDMQWLVAFRKRISEVLQGADAEIGRILTEMDYEDPFKDAT
jgi:hypothetical protein